jgi:hypothetical protein
LLHWANELVVSYGTSAPLADAEDQRQALLACLPHPRGQSIALFLSRIHVKDGVFR